MGVLQIVPVGPAVEPVLTGMRAFHTTKLALITDKEHMPQAKQIQKTLEPLGVQTEIHVMKGDPITETLRIVTTILQAEKDRHDDIYINVCSGTQIANTGALCAAYVNGAKALGVEGDKPFPLPILRVSYYDLVTDSKLAVLRALAQAGGQVNSLQELSELCGVDKSLLSYHIRGGRDQKGLEELGLVTIRRGAQGRLSVRLTAMGHMIVHGRSGEDKDGAKDPAKDPTRDAPAPRAAPGAAPRAAGNGDGGE